MSTVAKNPEVIYTELEDGAVLLNLENGFYYSLDTVGMEIWRLIDPAASPTEVGIALTQRFNVTPEQASSAATRFLDALEAERLVVPTTAEAGISETGRIATLAALPRPFSEPVLLKHDEPLNQVSLHPFDPQLPLAE